ncbi:MAG: nucleotidyl transferase AbiEii/AbiGii toxin family protein [Myxococcaceae bacterium]
MSTHSVDHTSLLNSIPTGSFILRRLLSGSMALNFYGQPRMTRDVDLVVELQPSDATKLVSLFGSEFACDLDEIRAAIQNERMFNLIHIERVVKFDFIVRKSSPYRLEEFQRRRQVELAGIRVWMVSPEDLVLSKLHWAKDSHSDLQLRDVKNLVGAVKALDWPYLRRWAENLGVAGLLAEVVDE